MTTLLRQFLALLVGTLVLFGALSVLITLLTRLIGEKRLRRWVGGNAITALVKGLLFGVITPFCSWSMIPVLLSLLRSRVRTSAVAAFFLASPVPDPVLIVAIGWLFGWWVATWFTVFLVVTTVAAAHVAERMRLDCLVLEHALTPAGTAVAPFEDEDACKPDEIPWRGLALEAGDAGRFAVAQMRQLFLPLVTTCAIGAAIAGAVPHELLTTIAGPSSPYAIPAAALLGAPLYLPTEALAPLGFGLRDADVGMGPIFAFLITAASLSLPEFVLLTRIFRMRLIAGMVLTILAMAVLGALLVPLAA